MGASASIGLPDLLSCKGERDNMASLPLMIGNGGIPTEGYVYGPIDTSLMALCEKSWLKVALNVSAAQKSQKDHGLMAFCYAFFGNVVAVDPENEFLALFSPRVKSTHYSREALLLRVIKYILSVPNDSFKVKSKIRSLGRAHARNGIVEKHFAIFNQALLMAIAERLEGYATYEVMKCWHDLLSFVTHQLTFDKIQFRPHITSDAEYEMSLKNDLQKSPKSPGKTEIMNGSPTARSKVPSLSSALPSFASNSSPRPESFLRGDRKSTSCDNLMVVATSRNPGEMLPSGRVVGPAGSTLNSARNPNSARHSITASRDKDPSLRSGGRIVPVAEATASERTDTTETSDKSEPVGISTEVDKSSQELKIIGPPLSPPKINLGVGSFPGSPQHTTTLGSVSLSRQHSASRSSIRRRASDDSFVNVHSGFNL
jgi:hemoglobin-like flavoprotein